ncbi:ABC transporter substrate-binding protein [Acuticoccus sp. I52.16.1]|uniref:ABC transporter substrate-binding protein n=1 Tax=Acuticoccus sp. I52.16.1 TaxID=2928472 RepID=UPI001FD2ED80|nr:ABC transporter substrate-binding protein [Acuticoccus sp. I52.16.1]UOM34959.1 ABC transporter substrate-binding protein [Acuticoccus sp. I52.16.1]
MLRTLMTTVAASAILVSGAALAQDGDPIKVGVTAVLEGTYTVLGEDGMRGFKLAMKQHDETAGGRKIEYVLAPTDASPDSAVRAVRKLIEQDKVDFVIGPLSGSEGIAVRDLAKQYPDVTIIDAASGAQETTYVNPSENYFRFNMDGAQWGVGLGDYVANEKGWKFVASVAEDYSFSHTNFLGFAKEFCDAGGEIVERFWVPLGTKDFASVIAALPDDVDAIYLGLGGGDAVNFLNQYQQAGGDANLIGGTIMVDGTVLNSRGSAKDALVGTPASSGQADTWDDPDWQAYVKAYQDAYPPEERFASPSLLATNYYNATTAALTCLDNVDGKLGGGDPEFRQCLSTLELDAPNGPIKLDENRQAIGTNFVIEVVEQDDGSLATQVVKKVDGVNQTLGMSKEDFDKMGRPGRDVPDC